MPLGTSKEHSSLAEAEPSSPYVPRLFARAIIAVLLIPVFEFLFPLFLLPLLLLAFQRLAQVVIVTLFGIGVTAAVPAAEYVENVGQELTEIRLARCLRPE